ncbi:unnamed protein product, partial [Mesorhabditis belari]|uniref:Transmembrane protein 229b n=1 Tax=Mesorhabditis belari TaxID=2138241 RepID=A0AAF3ER40_9BILA
MPQIRPWSRAERFIFYGVIGFWAEVCFTATWDAIENGNRKLIGVTSMYVFFVYGIAISVLEILYKLMKHRVPLLIRALIYMVFCFTWEFSFGMFLKRWDACPWDYASYFTYHFMGAITAEYIPVWYLATIFCEKVVIKCMLQARWEVDSDQFKKRN